MTVLESPDRWTVEVDVPGATLEDIDITLTDGSLVIEGQRKSGNDDGAKEVFNDRTFAKFRRELRIREGVDQSRIEADLKDGVLTLSLYRSPESSPQKISIRNARRISGQNLCRRTAATRFLRPRCGNGFLFPSRIKTDWEINHDLFQRNLPTPKCL